MLDDEDKPLAETEDFYGKYSVQKYVGWTLQFSQFLHIYSVHTLSTTFIDSGYFGVLLILFSSSDDNYTISEYFEFF